MWGRFATCQIQRAACPETVAKLVKSFGQSRKTLPKVLTTFATDVYPDRLPGSVHNSAACRPAPHDSRFRRGGFTLPEMLIVLAILAIMAALTLPAMRGPLDKSRLRSSATSVKAAIAKARASAIRSGSDVSFYYERNGNHWKIEASDSAFASQVGTSTDDLLAEEAPVTAAPSVIREGMLPEGCTFAESTVAEGVEGELLDEQASLNDQELIESGSPQSQRWATPLVFRPHGRGRDAEILIRGNRDFAVTVDVRGLTGKIAYSAPFRLAVSETSTLPDEVVD